MADLIPLLFIGVVFVMLMLLAIKSGAKRQPARNGSHGGGASTGDFSSDTSAAESSCDSSDGGGCSD
ncbi:hypothetical protein HNQ08_004400 [Deinococcus humi]|uniref:Uncharacterized protein n=1 Tax=Deinococcus humi TaxID=662880 RepID=A0A7W8NFC8_9DEIO|nr:hypothetical protein [Deinococcus humi]GGO35887.1 hypothetical protein GCM10008949_39040 [Deinococcus humi]